MQGRLQVAHNANFIPLFTEAVDALRTSKVGIHKAEPYA